MKTIIHTNSAPAAIGPYSQAVCVEETLLFTSGQLPVNPSSGKIEVESVAEQTEQSLKNLQAILEKVNLSLDNVIKTTVFLSDIADFQAMNEVYTRFFSEDCPARSCFQVAALPMGARVEIEAIATRE